MLSNLFLTLLKMNLMATCVAAVVLIFKSLLRKMGAPRKVLFFLWLVIALRFVSPVFLESNLSLFNWYNPFRIEQTGNEPIHVLTNNGTNLDFAMNQTSDLGKTNSDNNLLNDTAPKSINELNQNEKIQNSNLTNNMENGLLVGYQSSQTSRQQMQTLNGAEQFENVTNHIDKNEGNQFTWSSILMMVWILGTVSMLSYSIISYIKLKRSVMFAVKGNGDYYETDMIPTPCVVGLISPKIYLTPNVKEDDKRYILTHESTHIKRKDYFWKVFAYLILSFHWVNPFVHLFFKLFVDDMEMLCDEESVNILGEEEKEGYLDSLINLSSKKMNNLVPCPIAFSDNNTEKRVKNMIGWKKSGIAITLVAIVVCIVIACVCLTNRKDNSKVPNNEENHEEQNPVVAYEKQLQVIMDNMALWRNDFEMDGAGYAITDLDFNGRLEIISSSYGGTGGYTYNRVFEVNENFDGLTLCESNLIEGDSDVDIVDADFNTYYDAENNVYHYILNDFIRVSATEYYENKRDFYLKDGKITENYLAMKEIIYNDLEAAYTPPKISYTLPSAEEISENDYETIEKITFSGYENRLLNIEWMTSAKNKLEDMSEEKLLELLRDSYEKFGFYKMAKSMTQSKLEWNEEEKERMSYYEKALRDLYYNSILPDGTEVAIGMADDIMNDKFAICDIDNDGIDELIISHGASYMAGKMELIYEYDAQNHEFQREFLEFPLVAYYDNGVLEAGWSHNQGKAGEYFWPYTLYQYDSTKDEYEKIAMVDAWDKFYRGGFPDEEFPDEIDYDGNGMIYYIMNDDSFRYENPVDDEAYKSWRESYLGNAKEVRVAFQNLTGENIEYATRYGATKFQFTDTNESNVVNEETFTSFNGFEIKITNVIEKKTEKLEYADGSFSMEYPIYVCSPDSKIKIVNAGMEDGEVTQTGMHGPNFGLLINEKEEQITLRIFESMVNQYLDISNIDYIYDLESGIGVVGFEIDSNRNAEQTINAISSLGYIINIPEEYQNLLTIQTSDFHDEEGVTTIISVSETASIEAVKSMEEDFEGAGWIFSISKISENVLNEILKYDMSGMNVFAKDEDGNYFMMTF
ncbi:MAG: hypothetical protein IJ215_00085, partial [Clostridia bacterium]|nr:hypothetical protein [Clostridia bacterium]